MIIRGARPFGGNHRSSPGAFRRAPPREQRAIGRSLQSLQDFGADAFGRLFGREIAYVEHLLRVKPREFRPEAQPASRNRADPPPLAVAYLENALHESLGRYVAFIRYRPYVLVLQIG